MFCFATGSYKETHESTSRCCPRFRFFRFHAAGINQCVRVLNPVQSPGGHFLRTPRKDVRYTRPHSPPIPSTLQRLTRNTPQLSDPVPPPPRSSLPLAPRPSPQLPVSRRMAYRMLRYADEPLVCCACCCRSVRSSLYSSGELIPRVYPPHRAGGNRRTRDSPRCHRGPDRRRGIFCGKICCPV